MYRNSTEHAGVDVVWADDCGLDVLAVALHEHLSPESLVYTDSCEFAGAVVHQLVGAVVPGQAGHVHDVALSVVQHVR